MALWTVISCIKNRIFLRKTRPNWQSWKLRVDVWYSREKMAGRMAVRQRCKLYRRSFGRNKCNSENPDCAAQCIAGKVEELPDGQWIYRCFIWYFRIYGNPRAVNHSSWSGTSRWAVSRGARIWTVMEFNHKFIWSIGRNVRRRKVIPDAISRAFNRWLRRAGA